MWNMSAFLTHRGSRQLTWPCDGQLSLLRPASCLGDATEHLYWRLLNGEGPRDLKPRAVVVLIGTNDLNAVPDVSLCNLTCSTDSSPGKLPMLLLCRKEGCMEALHRSMGNSSPRKRLIEAVKWQPRLSPLRSISSMSTCGQGEASLITGI